MASWPRRVCCLATSILATTLAGTTVCERAHACETASPPSVTSGILGFETWEPDLASTLRLPRNLALAFWSSHGAPRLVRDGSAVPLELLGPEPTVGETGLMTPAQPLQIGETYLLNGSVMFRVADFVDTEPPAPPTLTDKGVDINESEAGCGGQGSCGTTVTVTARIQPGSDDHTPPERLTYALYLGASAKQARETESPARFGILEDGETWFFADLAWKERDIFLSVAALDFAGNQSTRTEPVLLRRAPSGCNTSGFSSFGTLAWVLLVLAGARVCQTVPARRSRTRVPEA